MPWASILSTLLSLAASIATYMQQRQLLDAGAAKAINNARKKADKAIAAARAARESVSVQPDEHDQYNRD